MISLVMLVPLWGGYFYSLYRGNMDKMFAYSMAVLTLSLLNSETMFRGEKTSNKVFDVLAKIDAVLVVGMAIIEVVYIIVK